MEIHPTEMSQGENGSDEEALQRFTSTIVQKIGEGAQKTESFFSSARIYRVPEELRKLKESAYTPRLIAIGPLHREDKHLQTPLQHVKMSYTNHLFSRLTAGMKDMESADLTMFTMVHKCLAELKTSIDDAKKCYAAEVTLNEKMMLEMMLVDGCFILEFLYRDRHRTLEGGKADPIFGNSSTLWDVQSDLVLLENQIPFFVLEKLFPLTVGRYSNLTLTDYVLRCYSGWMSPLPKSDDSSSAKTWCSCYSGWMNQLRTSDNSNSAKTWCSCYSRWMIPQRNSDNSSSARTRCSPRDCVLGVFGCTAAAAAAEEEEVRRGNIDHHRTAKYYHILHKLHDGYLPHHDQTKQTRPNFNFREMPSASELVYAGIKFVPDAGNDLFKFKFCETTGLFWWCHRAHFEIPPLVIYDHTESLFRNLIALEQCCPGVSEYVSSYAHVMDTLVNTDKDIQVLEKAGVLWNHLGATEDATDLFNKLCKEIVFGDYFVETCVEATKYSKRFWPKNRAHLRRTFFASPWTFIAFCIGLIAFAMSIIQFVRDFLKKSG